MEFCVKGWNWGEAKFRGSLLSFMVDSKPAFEIPLKEVSQVGGWVGMCVNECIGGGVAGCTCQGNSGIVKQLNFTHTLPYTYAHTHNQVITGKNEVTLEFHQNEATPVSLVEMRFHIPNAEGEGDAVAAFRDKALAHADIIQATGDAIVTFTEIQTLTPRYMHMVACNVSCYNVHVRSCSVI